MRLLPSLIALSLSLAPAGATTLPPFGAVLPFSATSSATSGVIAQNGIPVFQTYGAGLQNLFIGANAGNFTLAPNTTGVIPNGNLGIGEGALTALTYGNRNIAIGVNALNADTGGDGTVAIGFGAGKGQTIGYRNVYIGLYGGQSLSTSYENTSVGTYNLDNATGGTQNTSLGAFALHGALTGSGNATIGAYSLNALTTGARNVAAGLGSAQSLTTGSNNTILGSQAGASEVSGSGNVFVGFNAGFYETGSNKLYIANGGGVPLIFGDFAAGRVGIGTTAPGSTMDVNGAVNAAAYKVGGTTGVSCTGTPTAAFAVTNGIVTHC